MTYDYTLCCEDSCHFGILFVLEVDKCLFYFHLYGLWCDHTSRVIRPTIRLVSACISSILRLAVREEFPNLLENFSFHQYFKLIEFDFNDLFIGSWEHLNIYSKIVLLEHLLASRHILVIASTAVNDLVDGKVVEIVIRENYTWRAFMTHQNCLKLTDLTDSKSLFLLFCSQDLERMTGNKDILPAVVELDHFECIVPENDLSDKLTVTLKQD